MTSIRDDLLSAGLAEFERHGFEGATVAAIRARASASNGSFFHFFESKQQLAGTLFLDILRRYHAAMLRALDGVDHAEPGIAALIRTHLDWVAANRREARFLFEISRSEWAESVRGERQTTNAALIENIEVWRAPLVARGELLAVSADIFISQIIGPAQIFCRCWLSGRDDSDPRRQAEALIACAIRALAGPAATERGEATCR